MTGHKQPATLKSATTVEPSAPCKDASLGIDMRKGLLWQIHTLSRRAGDERLTREQVLGCGGCFLVPCGSLLARGRCRARHRMTLFLQQCACCVFWRCAVTCAGVCRFV